MRHLTSAHLIPYLIKASRRLRVSPQLWCMSYCRGNVWNYARVAHPPVGPLHLHASKSLRVYPHNISIRSSRSVSSRKHGGKRSVERGEFLGFLPDSSSGETRDIYVGDLDATLEAHRATNTAKIIRRVSAPTDPAIKHLFPRVVNDHEVHAEVHVAGESSQAVKDERVKVKWVKGIPSKEGSKVLKPWEYWPVGTIQHQRLAKAPQKMIRGSVQEYHARAMIPVDIWRRPSHGDENTDGLRPWLENVNEMGGEASQR